MICPECGVERQVVLCPPCTEKRVQELFSQIDREKKERREAVDRLYATEVAASKERDALLLQLREAQAKYDKISSLYCSLADTTLGTMNDLGHREAFEPGNLTPQQVEDCLTRVTQERDCANRLIDGLKNDLECSENNEELLEKRLREMDCQRLVEREEINKVLGAFADLDCCTGYTLSRDEYPKLWDALDEARRILGRGPEKQQTEKR